jgi:acetyltransferase-like isoleucine patch superfamily enzyme
MVGCPRNEDDAIMLHLYHKLHVEIERATMGTDIAPAYLAAIVSLESHPPGNRSSERFEPYVYQRLVDLKNDNRAFGKIKRESLVKTHIKKSATLRAGSVIMGGVTVGNYAVVGAGSVLTKNVPDYAIFVGNPAKFKGYACRCGKILDRYYRCSCGRTYSIESGAIKCNE